MGKITPEAQDQGQEIRRYEVRINKQIVTQFYHNRKDGLAKCLEIASKAVVKVKETSNA